MILLTEENIIQYLREKTNLLANAEQIKVRSFDNSESESGSGDGYINFVFGIEFFVQNEKKSYVIKQARPYSRNIPIQVPTRRNKIEYEGVRLKRTLVPEYLPELYFLDLENSAFVMESLTDWKILRYQFNKMEKPENLSFKIAEFLAVSNFFTSEIYHTTNIFRDLQAAFMNCDMRRIMENGIFVPEFLPLVKEEEKQATDPELYALGRNIWSDKELVAQCFVMRNAYMNKCECLIHGDFHTSNIFIRENQMKTIDMEYTFIGPYAYDLGYLVNNYISQYTASLFKPEFGVEKRKDFATYILSSIKDIYTYYIKMFDQLWDGYGKKEYSHSKEFRLELYKEILQDMLGYAAIANISRITVLTGFPDFDVIKDKKFHMHAKRLSLVISEYLLKKRKQYEEMDRVLVDILKITELYLKQV